MIARMLVALDGSPDFAPAAHVSHGDPLPAHMTEEAMRSLATLALALPAGVRLTGTLVRVGQPSWRTILQVADELDVDLIVLGSHGYDPLDRILGTTAGKVANIARRNVLVVHDRAGASAEGRSG